MLIHVCSRATNKGLQDVFLHHIPDHPLQWVFHNNKIGHIRILSIALTHEVLSNVHNIYLISRIFPCISLYSKLVSVSISTIQNGLMYLLFKQNVTSYETNDTTVIFVWKKYKFVISGYGKCIKPINKSWFFVQKVLHMTVYPLHKSFIVKTIHNNK